MMMWGKKKDVTDQSDSDETSIGSDSETGPSVSMIPSLLKDTACPINPLNSIGLSLSCEGWVQAVQPNSFAERSNIRIGTRVIRVETSRGYSLIDSTNELKQALNNIRIVGDEEAIIVCSGLFKGEGKWQGGVKHPQNGLIYGIPANAKEVLCINPLNNIATTFGQLEAGYDEIYGDIDDLWYHGVYSKMTNKIYGIPFNSTQILEIDPLNKKTNRISDYILLGKNKWRGGVCDVYGRIHCIPSDCNSILMFDPKQNQWELYGNELELHQQGGSNKWCTGCYCEHDDRILAIPFNAQSILMIDPEYKKISFLFENDILLKGYGKWSCGVFSEYDGCIYCIPYNSQFVLKIDPKLRTLTKLEGELKGFGKWNGGVLASDGCIYGIPFKSNSILKINILTQEVSTVGHIKTMKGRFGLWRGGVLGQDGNVYGIPCDSATALKLDTSVSSLEEEEPES